jgi:amino acid adenylation domain-containing protein
MMDQTNSADVSNLMTGGSQGHNMTFPTSCAQRRLWFVDGLLGPNSVYNLPAALRIRGPLELGALNRAVDAIVARHEALRTRFEADGGLPIQVVSGYEPAAFMVAEANSWSRAMELAEREACAPFDLGKGPLLRCLLIRLHAQEHLLVINIHHAVSDAWSMGVLWRELTTHYEAELAGVASPLEALPLQYGDFSEWQCGWLGGEEFDRQLTYWKQQLDGMPPIELPTDHPRGTVQSVVGAKLLAVFPMELRQRLSEVSRSERCTLFMTLLTAFGVLMARYTGQRDFGVGTPIANRNQSEIEGLIGLFVNMLVLRVNTSGRPDFRGLLRRVRASSLSAYEHQDLPFERLVEALEPERNLNRSPLVQVLFDLHNAPVPVLEFGGLKAEPVDLDTRSTESDLIVTAVGVPDGLAVRIEYATELFEAQTIERMLGHYRTLLEAVAADASGSIWELPILTGAETVELARCNDTLREYPRERTIASLFEEQARLRPEAVAVEQGELKWTYAMLNREANRVAHRLMGLGVGAETLVGICLDRSPSMIAALLGILKAGGAYVPLDPEYPTQRLELMLEDTGTRIVLSERALQDRFGGRTVVMMEDVGEDDAGDCGERGSGDSLAYVMYTSGSTGKPKGVAVVQRAVVRLVCNTDYVELGAEETLLQYAPLAFDASTFEIWGALLNGGRLVLFDGRRGSSQELGQAVKSHGVTTLWLTAGLFQHMVDERLEDLGAVKQLLAGGDVLGLRQVKRVVEELPGCRLINGYGPTEGTTFSCSHRVTTDQEWEHGVPIGAAIANTAAYLLDQEGNLVPVGVAGELYIGGDGLARGYVGRAELTAERFVPDGVSGQIGRRLYRTGDWARRRADGNLEFLGRRDHQVKVRGYRIELGEIEEVLAGHPQVQSVSVEIRRVADGDERLVSYVVLRGKAQSGIGELREWLRQRLPEYMVPAEWVRLESLPLTANGKVDRRALPQPQLNSSVEYVAPRTPLEETIAQIWEQVLQLPQVGVFDNFFDLGGHSLLGARLISRVNLSFTCAVPFRALFENATVAQFAVLIAVEQSKRVATMTERVRNMTPEEKHQLLQQLRADKKSAEVADPTWDGAVTLPAGDRQ